MPIQFNAIPINLRTPGTFIEIDNTKALRGLPQLNKKILVIGQRTSAGSIPQAQLQLVNSVEQAATYFGQGSMLHGIFKALKANNKHNESYAIALDDNGAGAPAAGSFAFSGTATENGTIHAYVGGQRVQAPVVSGDTAATVAAALGAAINADPVLPATSTVSTVTTTVTARNKGTVGNDIDLRLNYYGASSGEKLPAGLACVVTAMSGGTGDPTLSTALNAIPDEIFDFIILPYNDSTSLGALESELNDRHGPAQMLEGHAFIAKKASAGTLNTFGAGRNNPHVTCIGFNDSPTPPYEWAAAMGAQVALSATIDPARPFTTLPLVGVLAPAAGSAFIQSERNALLFDGITTFLVLSGVVQLERVITLYQVNALSAPDPSYLDANTLLTLSHLRQTINIRIRSKFPRHKLADNGTRFGAGQAMVTPNIIRAELIALFSEWEEAGLVENLEQFKNELIVERDPVDRTRVNAQLPPDLVNQLYIFAGQVQFRL